MIIGVDIRPMAGLRTGIQEYVDQILEHMTQIAPEDEFRLFYSSFKNRAPRASWMNRPNVKLFEFKIPNNLLFLTSLFFGYPKIDKLLGGVDVFFSPHFFIAPVSRNCPRVTTFHDLSYIRFPEFFTWRKRWWHNIEMNPKQQAQLSDHVIAVSKSTKKDIVTYYDIDPANIAVVYSGTNLVRSSKETLNKIKLEKKFPERYILHVGTLEPRKNISGLVKAFNLLKIQAGFEDLELILIGKEGWNYKMVLEEIKNSPFREQIRYLGHEAGDLTFYYSLASAFVCPSFFEGFGFPCLEAMACGVPIIVSANSSLPEVAGDAGFYVNPYNVSELAEALKIVLKNQTLRDQMIAKGLRQAANFSWAKTAKETIDIIHRYQ